MSTPAAVMNASRQRMVCEHVVIADRALTRMRGLLGRAELPAGHGLLLEPAPAVHTAFMRFPIDVVFLDAYLRVIKVVSPLAPWRSAAARGGRAVLELRAGQAGVRGVEVGDRLDVRERNHRAEIEVAAGHDDPARWAAATSDMLVLSTDRRFRSVAAALFSRRGWTVTARDLRHNLTDLPFAADPQVAVVDATPSLTDAARIASEVTRAAKDCGIVFVSAAGEVEFSGLPVYPKWGSFELLHSAVERARAGNHTCNRSFSLAPTSGPAEYPDADA